MISFRLSPQEYDQFRDYCNARGNGSVSELARAAVARLISDPAFIFDNVLETRVSELEGQLHMLALELKRVKEATACK